ncbi:MAG: hypothetical protein DRP02_11845 [Candidatus Gerdarchaeota archaeon]|nr:MAG: hypothetical protein DRP02_11845 [Candidatus Gerdarchaeota archaeon]
MNEQNEEKPLKNAQPRGSALNELLSVLSGAKERTEQDRIALLELSVKIGVCGLYRYYPQDVIDTFTTEELQEISDATEPFRAFTVEHIYKVALGR